MALKRLDLVLLEQERDTLHVAVDTSVLEFQHARQIKLRLADLDAHLRECVRGFLETLGREQQRLGWNAADIETGAAKGRPLLDNGHLHAELGGADRADIA